jgi:replicative DNA helicase
MSGDPGNNGHPGARSRSLRVPERHPTPEDRLPPQSLDAERALIGCVLIDPARLPELIPLVGAADFYRDIHQELWRGIVALADAGRQIDLITLGDHLGPEVMARVAGGGGSDWLRGFDYLAECVDLVPHALNAHVYAAIVAEKAIKRALIAHAVDVLGRAYADDTTAESLLESAERGLFAIGAARAREEVVPVADALADAMARLVGRGAALAGLSTGWTKLDRYLDGLQPEQLIVVAGRPSMGKSAAAHQLALVAALDGRAVFLASLEMGPTEVARRLLVAQSRVAEGKLRNPEVDLGPADLRALGVAHDALRETALHIDATATRTVSGLAAAARRIAARSRLDLVIVDYLQLVEADDPRESRQEQVAKVSRRLKVLARELKVPVVALSQLNRQVETREDRRPRMADLRESGGIEADADAVILLHRPEYYDPADRPGAIELIVAKNRNGATGTVPLTWRGELFRLDEPNAVDPGDPGEWGEF